LVLDGQFAGRTTPLHIAGPPGTRERLNATFEALYPGSSTAERDFEITITELHERSRNQLGPANLTPFPARHGGGAPAYSLRVDYGGKVIAYSGDTEWTDHLIEASKESDLAEVQFETADDGTVITLD
jgi:ribonuclease BN (tRNA processing enzyme)